MNYQDLYIFIKAVENKSLIATSRLLDIPISTLSRRIHQFEDRLGYKLLHISSKNFGVTEAGMLFYNELGPLIKEMEEKSESINIELSTLSGVIRVAAPVSFAHQCLKPWIFQFMQENPDIRVELFLSDDNVDLVKNSIDIAFRVGKTSLNNWISRSLFESRFMLCTQQGSEYKFDGLAHPSELNQFSLITTQTHRFWRFTSDSGESYTLSPASYMRVTECGFALEAVKEGYGIGFLPDYVATPALESGELVQLLPDWVPESREVYLLFPDRLNLPVKTRTFIDFVVTRAGGSTL